MRTQVSTGKAAEASQSKSLEPTNAFTRGRAPTCCALASLAEELSHDSVWGWLHSLSALLGDISHRNDRGDCMIKQYRLLLTVNAELTRSLLAIRSQVSHSEFGLQEPKAPYASGLRRWQVRRAREFLATHLGTNISVDDVAATCGLSRAYFTSAFRRATGETPHVCLLRLRIERAKTLLTGPLTIADIALECGFADQSHLTRAFAKQIGITPGLWRRERRGEEWI
jgi:AraC-like DNA-binding protein